MSTVFQPALPIDPADPKNSQVSPPVTIGDGTGGTNLLGIPTSVFSKELWTRIGIGAIGVVFLVIGLFILLSKPVSQVATAVSPVGAVLKGAGK